MPSASVDSRREAGFTVIEVLVSATLLIGGLLGTLKMVDVATGRTAVNGAREAAMSISREVIEGARRAPYGSLTAAGAEAQLKTTTGLGSGTPWQTSARGMTFTIAVTACALDDPADGYGAHAGTGWCTQSATVGTQDKSPVDLRRIGITVTWNQEGRTRRVAQGTVVRDPGDTLGPAVTNLTSSLAGDTFTFNATAEATATRVAFFVDGELQSDGVLTAGTWRTTWLASGGANRGTHYVDAKAYDTEGRSRPTVTRITVVKP